jgi:hypothetical protein
LHSYLWAAGENNFWIDQGTGSFSGDIVQVQVTSPRFGFDANLVQNVDRVSALVGTIGSVKLNVSTPIATATVTATPKASTDGTFRAVGSVEIMGRGVTVQTVTNNGGINAQWSVQQVQASGVSSVAGPDDA